MQPMSLIFQVQDGTWSGEIPAATAGYSGTSHRCHVYISYIILWQAEPAEQCEWINLPFKWQQHLSPTNSVVQKHMDTSIILAVCCLTALIIAVPVDFQR